MISSRFFASALAFLIVDGAHASVCRPHSRSSALSAAESLSTADESTSGTSTVGVSTAETSSAESFTETLTTTASLGIDTSSGISSFVTITTTTESSEVTSSETASSTFFPADLFPCEDTDDCVAKVRLCDFVRCGCVGGFCLVETATTDSSTAETSTAIEETATADTTTTDTITSGTTTTDITTTVTAAESSTVETTTADTTIDPTTTDTATTITTAESSTTETKTTDTTTAITTFESSMATTTDITTADTTTATTVESSTAETTTSDTTAETTTAETTTAETTTAETTTAETTTTAAKAQSTAFKCDVYGYLIQKTTLYRVDIATGKTTLVASNIGPGGYINGIGYNRFDNQIYGMVTTSTGSRLIKIGADGSWTLLSATVSNRNIIMGDIDNTGSYWISDTGRPWWRIDLYPTSPTYGQVIQSGTASHDNYIADWAFVPGGGDYLYALQYTVSSSTLVRFSRTSYTWTTLKAFGDLTGDNVWGGLYASQDGILYGSENSSGNIYKFPLRPTIGNPSFVSAGPSTSWNDGARCIDSQPV
ncbi:hypothetical protein FSARC_12918 [Fusarium sarcochroum]|uniref:DUF6923 domain-containing protein n=1 Tax=Fusarium sarcochroum TaxID=1208366 RepID=A0A8H4T513_9HYPO|nr:hypothetical protein FSARC_12918 [Fusarium sarcochroum]